MLDGLSREDIARLESVINNLDDLLERQEEIVKRLLVNEEKIGKLRIAYIKQANNEYLKGLNAKIARKNSKLNETYLIADHEAAKKYTAATSESGGGSGGSSNGNTKVDQVVSDQQIKELSEALLGVLQEDMNKMSKLLSKNREERMNEYLKTSEDALGDLEKLENEYNKKQLAHMSELTDQFEELAKAEKEATALQLHKEEATSNRIKELSLAQQQSTVSAELAASKKLIDLDARYEYYTNEDYSEERYALERNEANAKAQHALDTKTMEALEKRRAALQRHYALKNHGELSEKDAKRIEKDLKKEFKERERNQKDLNKARMEQLKKEQAEEKKAVEEQLSGSTEKLLGKGNTLEERAEELKELTTDDSGKFSLVKTIFAAVNIISDLAKQLEATIDEIASGKSAIDTRLQGSKNETIKGSYWDQMIHDVTAVSAITPYFRQADFTKNLQELVSEGIAFEVEQRAFLMTVKDKIATTFNVADSALLRLVRIQQEDTTAGRLGMESALNAFLNNMYETSEYLSNIAASVRGSLTEMEALMSSTEATEVEYQVQKWLGSLYSVGMSEAAVSGIADTLGQIASGQIEGLEGGTGNLLIMAANDAGMSIADILTDGINSSDTNKLLQAAVNYLADLSESAEGNKVVQQQLANVFGVKASDLVSATNLTGSIEGISGNSMSYNDMINRLLGMAGSMQDRTSLGEMMTNVWENVKYSIAGAYASNPATYFIYKMATLLDNVAGGIPIPDITALGNGVMLNTTVSDILRVASTATGIVGSISDMWKGLGNSFSGKAMLEELGITSGSGPAVVVRGSDGGNALAAGLGSGAVTSSTAGFIGNGSGSDIIDSTKQQVEDSKDQLMVEALEEEEANQIDSINVTVLKIYELLDDVANGNSTLKVKVEGYGLTKASSGGAQGGVSAIDSTMSGGGFGGINSSISGGVSGSVDTGNWTMV